MIRVVAVIHSALITTRLENASGSLRKRDVRQRGSLNGTMELFQPCWDAGKGLGAGGCPPVRPVVVCTGGEPLVQIE
jgi:hypothetical protein